MALSRAIDEKLSSASNLPKLFALGLLLGATAFLLQTRPVGHANFHIASPVRQIDASGPRPSIPKPA